MHIAIFTAIIVASSLYFVRREWRNGENAFVGFALFFIFFLALFATLNELVPSFHDFSEGRRLIFDRIAKEPQLHIPIIMGVISGILIHQIVRGGPKSHGLEKEHERAAAYRRESRYLVLLLIAQIGTVAMLEFPKVLRLITLKTDGTSISVTLSDEIRRQGVELPNIVLTSGGSSSDDDYEGFLFDPGRIDRDIAYICGLAYPTDTMKIDKCRNNNHGVIRHLIQYRDLYEDTIGPFRDCQKDILKHNKSKSLVNAYSSSLNLALFDHFQSHIRGDLVPSRIAEERLLTFFESFNTNAPFAFRRHFIKGEVDNCGEAVRISSLLLYEKIKKQVGNHPPAWICDEQSDSKSMTAKFCDLFNTGRAFPYVAFLVAENLALDGDYWGALTVMNQWLEMYKEKNPTDDSDEISIESIMLHYFKYLAEFFRNQYIASLEIGEPRKIVSVYFEHPVEELIEMALEIETEEIFLGVANSSGQCNNHYDKRILYLFVQYAADSNEILSRKIKHLERIADDADFRSLYEAQLQSPDTRKKIDNLKKYQTLAYCFDDAIEWRFGKEAAVKHFLSAIFLDTLSAAKLVEARYSSLVSPAVYGQTWVISESEDALRLIRSSLSRFKEYYPPCSSAAHFVPSGRQSPYRSEDTKDLDALCEYLLLRERTLRDYVAN